MKTLLLFVLLFPAILVAQISDDFEDGDFTANPAWTGTTEKFIINGSKQLQLNDTAASSAYLVTGNSKINNTEWRCWVKCSFSPSSNNNARVYLTSSQANLSGPLNGYFLQLGESGSDDAVELFRQEGETVISVCRGTDGLIASSFAIRIKVTRDALGLWKVYADPAGGENFQPQGEGTDNTFAITSFFGFYGMYTVSYSSKMYFDDVYVGPEIIDSDPPVVNTVSPLSDTTLLVVFSETVDKMSGENTSNYEVNKGVGMPVTAAQNDVNGSEVMLSFDNKFDNGQEYSLSVSGVKDLSGNLMNGQQIPFSFYMAQPNDLVINEIMADPTPQVGLPDAEFVELMNTTDNLISLAGWTLTVGTSEKVFGEEATIEPGGFLLLADEGDKDELSEYGPFYGFSSLALTNTGQHLLLSDKEGTTISEVEYSDGWYNDQEKKDGGWTLEQINPANVCSGSGNWTASMDPAGGTPGSVNSVYDNILLLPAVQKLEVAANNLLRTHFNQSMNENTLAEPTNYFVDQGIGTPGMTFTDSNEPEMVELYFDDAFTEDDLYNLTVYKSVENCIGMHPANDTIILFGLGQDAAENDLVINEILFNPLADGVDFVEVYNKSIKTIDLNRLRIGTVRNSPPAPPDTLLYQISNEQYLLLPGSFLVLTLSPETVKSQYFTPNPEGFLIVDPFPAYNNDAGTCLLVNGEGTIVDAFSYNESMHYPLLNYVDGVSLERISFSASTQDENNWHSAAGSVGYATPAYMNSQAVQENEMPEELTIDPEIFSPDNDGYNDVINISYSFPVPGYMLNIKIFDSNGNPVKYLANNQYIGTTGMISWDGLEDDNTKAPVGIYVFYIQVFDLDGNVKKFKLTGVLASKL